ncbi:unnamed protein product [Bursaphelenchus xylophilus]|uniref:(pine wood nematode) hypothetical protein n=1 Tax=Bursaphelenchus xylophilus TaxID=6326 RepID=A0A1I7SRD3_BURXY|nr:unnamed protein product [Bursaphelenchus xylophilus]CAG9102579.1 unnamed protein product [Bursaphelenchus xylophilus]
MATKEIPAISVGSRVSKDKADQEVVRVVQEAAKVVQEAAKAVQRETTVKVLNATDATTKKMDQVTVTARAALENKEVSLILKEVKEALVDRTVAKAAVTDLVGNKANKDKTAPKMSRVDQEEITTKETNSAHVVLQADTAATRTVTDKIKEEMERDRKARALTKVVSKRVVNLVAKEVLAAREDLVREYPEAQEELAKAGLEDLDKVVLVAKEDLVKEYPEAQEDLAKVVPVAQEDLAKVVPVAQKDLAKVVPVAQEDLDKEYPEAQEDLDKVDLKDSDQDKAVSKEVLVDLVAHNQASNNLSL